MRLTTIIHGDVAVLARMAGIPSKTSGVLSKTIESLAVQLQAHVVRDKLSGSPLHRRTGDLSRSVNYKLENEGMTAVVGANVPYAARQEYGFTGSETVRSHVRRSRAQTAKARRNKLGYETPPSKAAGRGTGLTEVRSFTRQINYPAHSYLRSALDDMRTQIVDTLRAAGMSAVKA